jgi:FixJ family two-component response regulator
MRALVILVNADLRALRHTEALLSEAGHLVAALSSFVEAKKVLDSVIPDLLVADIRLAAFNGLHLAIRSHFEHPDIPVIITHVQADPIFEAQAEQYGARFVAAPLGNPDYFLACVESALIERRRTQAPIRRWSRQLPAAAVQVSAGDARAEIVDMSYGGVRLAFNDSVDLPGTFDITLPSTGITVKAHRVWTASSKMDDHFWCGAELEDTATGDWRGFVNTLKSSEATQGRSG